MADQHQRETAVSYWIHQLAQVEKGPNAAGHRTDLAPYLGVDASCSRHEADCIANAYGAVAFFSRQQRRREIPTEVEGERQVADTAPNPKKTSACAHYRPGLSLEIAQPHLISHVARFGAGSLEGIHWRANVPARCHTNRRIVKCAHQFLQRIRGDVNGSVDVHDDVATRGNGRRILECGLAASLYSSQ